MTQIKQGRFETIDKLYLDMRVNEAKEVISEAMRRSDKPLVVQFSGGKDSMAMLGLTREITNNFVCGYMKTGIEFPEAIEFAKSSANRMGIDLLISNPNDHLGGFWERLNLFGWPTVKKTWCNRDLKVRPQQKMLNRELGKGEYYKLVGVRKYESTRRKKMHQANSYFVDDYNTSGVLVYPLLLWNKYDVTNYLRSRGLPTSGLYNKYGVSGCYWCPFYQADIYRKVLQDCPNLYDDFIKQEEKFGASVNGYIFLRDLKKRM